MPNDTGPPGTPPLRDLAQLASEVRAARAEVAARRVQPVTQPSLLAARQELLRVMELYSAELIARRLPVPHQLRDDLRLLRDIRRNAGFVERRRGYPTP